MDRRYTDYKVENAGHIAHNLYTELTEWRDRLRLGLILTEDLDAKLAEWAYDARFCGSILDTNIVDKVI